MLFDDSGARVASELLDRLDQIGSPGAWMARVVSALWIAQEQGRSIASVRIVTGLHEDGGHAAIQCRGSHPGNRVDKPRITTADLAGSRRVHIDPCQSHMIS